MVVALTLPTKHIILEAWCSKEKVSVQVLEKVWIL